MTLQIGRLQPKTDHQAQQEGHGARWTALRPSAHGALVHVQPAPTGPLREGPMKRLAILVLALVGEVEKLRAAERARCLVSPWATPTERTLLERPLLGSVEAATPEELPAGKYKALPAGWREAIAGVLFHHDCDHEMQMPTALYAGGLLKHRGEKHDGDCTKMPYTCMRCVCDDVYALTDRILAALSPNQPTEQADSGAVSTGAIGGQS